MSYDWTKDWNRSYNRIGRQGGSLVGGLIMSKQELLSLFNSFDFNLELSNRYLHRALEVCEDGIVRDVVEAILTLFDEIEDARVAQRNSEAAQLTFDEEVR